MVLALAITLVASFHRRRSSRKPLGCGRTEDERVYARYTSKTDLYAEDACIEAEGTGLLASNR